MMTHIYLLNQNNIAYWVRLISVLALEFAPARLMEICTFIQLQNMLTNLFINKNYIYLSFDSLLKELRPLCNMCYELSHAPMLYILGQKKKHHHYDMSYLSWALTL